MPDNATWTFSGKQHRTERQTGLSAGWLIKDTACFLSSSAFESYVVTQSPFEYGPGGAVTVDPSSMKPDDLYQFRILGHPVITIKRRDDSLEFYYVPDQ